MSDKSESLTKLEEDEKYNRLTALKLFAMTSSMVISVNELAPFGKTGPTAVFYLLLAGLIWFVPITQMAGEMASVDGWWNFYLGKRVLRRSSWLDGYVLSMDSHYCWDEHNDVRNYWCIIYYL